MFLGFHLSKLKKHWIFPLLAGCMLIFVLLFAVNIRAVKPEYSLYGMHSSRKEG